MKNKSLIFLLFIIVLFSITGCKKEDEKPSLSEIYSIECPITINGQVFQNSNNTSSVWIYFHNISDTDISAVKYLIRCYNVYGEEISYNNNNYIYQKNIIKPQESEMVEVTIPHYSKKVAVYIYSAYYINNVIDEWGVKEGLSKEDLYEYVNPTIIEYTK